MSLTNHSFFPEDIRDKIDEDIRKMSSFWPVFSTQVKLHKDDWGWGHFVTLPEMIYFVAENTVGPDEAMKVFQITHEEGGSI